jgi:hypothetical protein
MTADEQAKLFHEGVALFNAHEWFEAHEVWEDIWHMAQGPRKRFLQGLIQAAVTLEHVRRGNPRGVRTVFATCVPKFDGLPDLYMGVDIRRLLRELEAAIRPILDLPEERFDPALPRGQDLPFDPAAAPKIELAYDPFAR